MNAKLQFYKLLSSRYAKAILRNLILHRITRAGLNVIYNAFTPRERLIVGLYYAALFKGYLAQHSDLGIWSVRFAGKTIHLPIRPTSLDLDWTQALNIIGREPDIVSTIQDFVHHSPPQLFVDIGANYGLYSLLFLSHGIDVISFEPNAACLEYFHTICALNGVKPYIENVALSHQSGVAELLVPDNNTVLGSLEPYIWTQWKNEGYELFAQEVEVRTLDSYMPILTNQRLLIKIDAEGHEKHILEGASQILETIRPTLIFESYSRRNREAIFSFLTSKRYMILQLPYNILQEHTCLKLDEFLSSAGSDFIAIPLASL